MPNGATADILVVDDDREIAAAISLLLEREGLSSVCAHNGQDALEQLESGDFKLCILDVMMPQLDGLSTLMRLREKRNIPVIMLSAKTEDNDRIMGLTLGADDYVCKPFNPAELMARVKAQLRRYNCLGCAQTAQSSSSHILSSGWLMLDTDAHQLYVDNEPVHLTKAEYRIVELLLRNAGRVFSAEEIYRICWQEDSYSVENTVMVHIRRIREKIEINPSSPKYLKVVWGIGYKIEKL